MGTQYHGDIKSQEFIERKIRDTQACLETENTFCRPVEERRQSFSYSSFRDAVGLFYANGHCLNHGGRIFP